MAMELLHYNGKDREVFTGVRGGKHLIIDEKKRYLTKEHKDKIWVKEVTDLTEKLQKVALEPEEEAGEEVEAVAEEQAAEIAVEEEEEASEENASEEEETEEK